jgi:hypothetical protein
MLNPARDLEYPFIPLDTSTILVGPKNDIPAEHALEKDAVIDPTEGLTPVEPRNKPKDSFDAARIPRFDASFPSGPDAAS